MLCFGVMAVTQSMSASFEKTKERPLHEQVRDHLREHCSRAQPDTALPTLRRMSDALGVNHITISRALRDLEAEGLLRVVPGKGTFVTKAGAGNRGIEMLTIHTPFQDLLDTSRHMFQGMQNAVGEDIKLSGSILSMPPVPKAQTFLQTAKARHIDGVVIFGFGYLEHPDSFLEAQFIYEVSEQMPVVLVGKEHRFLELDSVYCDPLPLMLSYLEECYDAGKRNFKYVGGFDLPPHLQVRRTVFLEFLLSRGLPWIKPSTNNEIGDILDAEPEVIIVSNPYSAHQLVIEAQQRGIKLGTDLQILCFAGSPEQVGAIAPYITVILLEEEEVGRCAIDRLRERLSDTGKPAPLVTRIAGKIVRPSARLHSAGPLHQ
jgi:DNA-binding LacI/PurR family transcriptional regulator/DNA-binding transcriptional regulator YhcF (GntR family)